MTRTMTRTTTLLILSLVVAMGWGLISLGASPTAAHAGASESQRDWFTAWASSQEARARRPLDDQTVRMITRVSQGGDAVRVRVQDQFGSVPLTIAAAAVARTTGTGPGVEAGTSRPLTFGGQRSITVPAHAQAWSDPVRMATTPRDELAVSLWVPGHIRPGVHWSALRENYLTRAGSGDHVGEVGGAAFTRRITSAYLVTAVDVHSTTLRGTIVAFGSSVVDGTGSTNCGPGCRRSGNDQRWSDDLAQRIVHQLRADQQFAVADAGIGATTSSPSCPHEPARVRDLNAGARLGRDVLALHGVREVLYYDGMNDLDYGCTGRQIIASYKTVFGRLRHEGIRVFVVPPTPRIGYTARQNVYRGEVDRWVEAGGDCGGRCTGLLHFGRVIADPRDPAAIAPWFDNGDGIHVNIAAQRAEAGSIPLRRVAAPMS